MRDSNVSLILSGIIHAIFLWCILLMMSKIIIIPTSQSIIRSQIKKGVQTAASNVNTKIDLKNKNKIQEQFDKQDVEASLNNQLVMLEGAFFLLIFVALFFFVIAFRGFTSLKLIIFHAFIENIVLFIGIGFIEYYFFMNFATKFEPVNENDFKINIFENILSEINEFENS